MSVEVRLLTAVLVSEAICLVDRSLRAVVDSPPMVVVVRPESAVVVIACATVVDSAPSWVVVSEPTWVEVSAAACLVDNVLSAVVVAELSWVVDKQRRVKRIERGRGHGAEFGRGQRLHLRRVER